MKNYNFDNAPYVFWAKSSYVRTLKLEKSYENMIEKVGENDVLFCDTNLVFESKSEDEEWQKMRKLRLNSCIKRRFCRMLRA